MALYPTEAEVQAASKGQLATWCRHLASPINEAEVAVMNSIIERFMALGGWTPALSKGVGWGPRPELARFDEQLRDEYDTGLDKTGPQWEEE